MTHGRMRTLTDGAGVVPLTDHAVLRVRGDAPLRFLQDTTTQDLLGLAQGRGALTCLLNEKGRVLAEVRVLALSSGDVLLDGEAAARRPVLDGLGRVAPLSGCEVIDESAGWEAVAVRGPRAGEALGVEPPPEEEHGFVEVRNALVVRVLWGVPGLDVLAPRGRMPPADADPASPSALEAARIAAGRPRFGIDVTEDLLVNETPLLERAVSFTKGCYPGQESVARVRNLGRARRALVGLRIAGPAPAPGAPISAGDAVVGRVTSAGTLDGEAVAIALVRSEVGPGDAVVVGGAPAVVRALP